MILAKDQLLMILMMAPKVSRVTKKGHYLFFKEEAFLT